MVVYLCVQFPCMYAIARSKFKSGSHYVRERKFVVTQIGPHVRKLVGDVARCRS
jgi:hypothetical protein